MFSLFEIGAARGNACGGVVRRAGVWCSAVVMSLTVISSAGEEEPQVLTYLRCSDASACVILNGGRIAIADDEDNTIRVYDMHAGGGPIDKIDLTAHLESAREGDIEAAARAGDVVYWIGSHGRNKEGKWRESRHCFFSTRVVRDESGAETLEKHGRSYSGLLGDMLDDDRIGPLIRSGVGAVGSMREVHAPKREGINFEGLAATPEGTLLIAFRNPGGRHMVDADGFGSALVLEILNPSGVVEGGEQARFGLPIWIGLPVQGRYGIRSMARCGDGAGYYFVAGLIGAGVSESALCRWDGASERAELVRVFEKGFNAEAAECVG